MSDLIVRTRHLRAARICMGGARAWFTRHELSWTDFLANGIPANTLRGFGDPLADRAVAEAARENENGR